MQLTKLISALSCAAVLALTPAVGHASLLSDIQSSFYTNGVFGNWTNGAVDKTFQSGMTGTSNGGGPVGNVFWTEANNIAPGLPGDVPSGGEQFDMEFLAWRINVQTNKFEVLGVSSVDPVNGTKYGTRWYHTGDVFMELDGDASTGYQGTGDEGWDAALSIGVWNNPGDGTDSLHPAETDYPHNVPAGLYSVVDVDDVHGVATGGTGGYGTGHGTVLPALLNPFALRDLGSPALLAPVTVAYTQIVNDGGRANYATEWTMDLADLQRLLPPAIGGGPDYSNLRLHWTVGCGNDYLETEEPGDRDPIIPEPATLALLGLGLGTLGFVRRRR